MVKIKKKKYFQKIITILLILLVAFIYNNINPTKSITEDNKTQKLEVSTELQIQFLDVGQADSILIINNGHYMLIDAGNDEDGPKLVEYFNELGIEKFDYVIGTHPHEDHIGGLDDIIYNFDIEEIILPDAYTTSKTFEDLLTSIEKKEYKITIPEIDKNFNMSECLFEVIYTGTGENDLNEASIILKMTFGNTTYLFTGDTIKEVEEKILDKDINIDVLKVAHHGSPYSTSNKFLLKTKPKYAIISVGKYNTYNHPSKETLNRLTKFTNEIYRTDELGTIILKSDGNEINISFTETNTNG